MAKLLMAKLLMAKIQARDSQLPSVHYSNFRISVEPLVESLLNPC